MNKYLLYIILPLMMIGCALDVAGADVKSAATSKQERNLINEGNNLYHQQRFADAEVLYRKALELKPTSQYAQYNLATALIRQSGSKDLNKDNNPLTEAKSILSGLLEVADNDMIVEKASYNLGNIAFNNNDFKGAIEYYKNALRKNPANDQARQNLRLAQKKQQEQQNNQNQQQQQQQQNQNQDQNNKDQNQNKEEDKKQQDQQQQDQQKKQEEQKDKQSSPQEQNGISDANAEKILKAMENEEAATRRRVEAQRKKGGDPHRRQPLKPW